MFRSVEAILVLLVCECPITKFWLIWRGVDLVSVSSSCAFLTVSSISKASLLTQQPPPSRSLQSRSPSGEMLSNDWMDADIIQSAALASLGEDRIKLPPILREGIATSSHTRHATRESAVALSILVPWTWKDLRERSSSTQRTYSAEELRSASHL